MVSFWLYKYAIEDRDIGVVDYVRSEKVSDLGHPVVSLCFRISFVSQDMIESDMMINGTTYLDYLKGDIVQERFENVDFSNITSNFEESLINSQVTFKNETTNWNVSFETRETYTGIDDFGNLIKCFELISTTTYEDVTRMIFILDKKGIQRVMGKEFPLFFGFAVHHSGQFLLAPNRLDNKWMVDWDCNGLDFDISEIEILYSRNSRQRSCTHYGGIDTFDELVRKKYLHTLHCRPPFISSLGDLPICSNKEDILISSYQYQMFRDKYYPPSCQRYSKILYKTELMDYALDDLDDIWTVTIFYPEYVRMITQSKDVDAHALIGNIGGYVGLLLGK